MPKWNDFGNVWATLRELDINAIREEAERPLALACVGHEAAVDEVDRLLHTGSARYPVGANPLEIIPLAQAADRSTAARSADMLILAIDARQTLTPAEAESFGQLEILAIPFLVVQLHGDRPPTGAASLPAPVRTRAVVIAEPAVLDAPDRLAGELLTRLPGELHLSAARRLPGLRAMFARELIGSVAFTNATYSLASGLPQQIPIFSIPFAAADILVLTKNQALLVYKLALAYGAPSDFQARIREVLPVIGGAFLWRQAARSLVGLIPFWGLLPKVAVAYAGTYTTGVAAWRWYESGEIVSTEQLKRISTEAMTIGRARAAEIMARARVASTTAGARVQASGGGILSRLKRLFSRRKPPELTPPKTD
ncbi:MAG TPA: hypothetical protein VFO07_13085 [Roseiflexaceae bacterium]|nr:hypothetical protein [Roseiflexaceae bacterium]